MKRMYAVGASLLFAVGVACWIRFTDFRPEAQIGAPVGTIDTPSSESYQSDSIPGELLHREAADLDPQPEMKLLTESVTVTPMSVNPVDGYKAESKDFLMAMLRHPEIEVSEEELSEMLNAYVETTILRTTFESSICDVETINENERVLRIPEYAPEGNRMYERLLARFRSVLKDDRATKVEALVGPELYIRNYGFGESEQTITVNLRTDIPDEYYFKFVHSASPFSVDFFDPERGTTRSFQLGKKSSESSHRITALGSYAPFSNHLPTGG